MNLYTAQMNKNLLKTNNTKRKVIRKSKKSGFPIAMLFKIMGCLVAVFVLAVFAVKMETQVKELSNRSSKIKRTIKGFNRDIAGLKIARERLSGRYLLANAKRLHLKLRPATPGQVIPLKALIKENYSARPHYTNVDSADTPFVSQR